ncbi:MAG TPA: tetraacyldisaccharide 4'-kinase, partial [bacterium]|nr:tetraacyldisaccharide 4'-kinase [bacterium]
LLTKTNLLPFLERPVVGPQPSENRPRMLPATRDWILGSLAEYAAGVPVIEVPATGLHLELVWDPPPETPERGTAEPLEAAEAESEPPAPEPGGNPMRLLPVSAIGNAEGYEATCRMAGLRFRDPVRYDDHTVFSQGDVLWWTQLARQWDYPGIVVTSKDWVKIHPLRGGLRVRCYVLTMRLEPPDWGQVIRMEAGDGRGAAQ